MLYNKDWEKPTTPSQVLRKAATLMETHGHAKRLFVVRPHHLRDENNKGAKLGSMCIQGAIMAAIGVPDEQIGWDHMIHPLVQKSIEHLAVALDRDVALDHWHNNSAVVASWNNYHATQEQIVSKVREVADQLEMVCAE